MSKLDANSPEIPSAASHSSQLEGIRRLVDAAFETIPDIDDLQFAAPPDEAVPVNTEGRVVDGAQHRRIKEAEQAVLDALETMPKPDPAQFKDLLPG